MRLRHLGLLLATPFAAFTISAQQPLVCSAAPVGRPCDAYHFHVQLYRPDSKQFVEVSGVNQFATQTACDRARDLHIATNANAVEYLRGIRKQYEADRVGPCHCDMTSDEAAADFLSDAERTAQLRVREEVRLRLRERLLDEKLTSDSEIVRGLWSEPAATPQLNAPKFATMPQSAVQTVLTAPEDLKPTKTLDTAKPVVAALDLPLIDLAAPAPEPPPATLPLDAEAATASLPEPAPEEIVVDAPVAPELHDTDAAIESTVPEHDPQSAQETAERFVEYEKQRIQNILRASASITDEEIKSKIFDACMQRIQLLSNVRLLIEGSGMRSRLATAARDAVDERDRIALIRRLFGDDVAPHWAPREAADVIFEVDPAVAAEPERMLRDITGDVSAAQKKRALYLVLTQSHPSEDQLLWLSGLVDEFLQ
jgi:hypothetical protein